MDLSKHTLEECLIFIEKENYTIKQYNHVNKNTYTLLYICDDMDTKLAIQYNQYYECTMGKFDSFDDLEIQLNVWNHGYRALAIGIFYQNTNITKEYNINNFNTYLDKGNKLTDEYKTKHNSCYKCIHKKIYELAKLELTEISKSYLMEFIATQLDLLNDEETEENEENKDMLKQLEEIYESELRIYSYCIYKDSEINKTELYILTGYILDKDLSENDMFIKKIILTQLIKYHTDFYNILSLEELKKLI